MNGQHPIGVVFALLCVVGSVGVGCDKQPAGTAKPGPSASAGALGPASAAAAAAAADAAAPTAAAAGKSTAWQGSYMAKVAPIELPANVKERSWADDSGKDAVGAGTLELTVNGREVRGQAQGPLGPLALAGVVEDRQIRALATPTDPNAPNAMTGWLVLAPERDGAEGGGMNGTIHVSNRDARLVREATLQVSRR